MGYLIHYLNSSVDSPNMTDNKIRDKSNNL